MAARHPCTRLNCTRPLTSASLSVISRHLRSLHTPASTTHAYKRPESQSVGRRHPSAAAVEHWRDGPQTTGRERSPPLHTCARMHAVCTPPVASNHSTRFKAKLTCHSTEPMTMSGSRKSPRCSIFMVDIRITAFCCDTCSQDRVLRHANTHDLVTSTVRAPGQWFKALGLGVTIVRTCLQSAGNAGSAHVPRGHCHWHASDSIAREAVG